MGLLRLVVLIYTLFSAVPSSGQSNYRPIEALLELQTTLRKEPRDWLSKSKPKQQQIPVQVFRNLQQHPHSHLKGLCRYCTMETMPTISNSSCHFISINESPNMVYSLQVTSSNSVVAFGEPLTTRVAFCHLKTESPGDPNSSLTRWRTTGSKLLISPFKVEPPPLMNIHWRSLSGWRLEL